MTRHERGHEHGREDLPQQGSAPRDAPGSSGDTPDEKHTTELYGPDGPLNDRTGKETVNDGPRNGMDHQGLGGDTPRRDVPGAETPSGDLPGRDRLLRDLLGGPAQDAPAPTGNARRESDGPDRGHEDREVRRAGGRKGRHEDGNPEGRQARRESRHGHEAGPYGSDGRTASAAALPADGVPGAPTPTPTPTPAPAAAVPGPATPPAAAVPDVTGPDGLGGDELALRRLLRDTVGDLEPTDGALDHLRRAVPARRARKRQALVGMAASVILLGTAVPAFVHVASSGGLDDHPVNAGHGEQAQGGTGDEERLDGGQASNGDPAGGRPNVPGAPSARQQSPSPGAAASPGIPGGTGATPSDGAVASTPVCEAGQLGVNAAQAGAAEADGKVYGTFRISNISPSDCSIGSPGAVSFSTAGAADATKISVVTHTTGDAASGLPDPSEEISAVVLKPEASYEVKFAFVPSETCPTTGASPDPTPTDGTAGTTDGAGTTPNTEPQLDDGTVADGSISVVHTPEAGGPSAEVTIPNACAGTIYRTGVLNPS